MMRRTGKARVGSERSDCNHTLAKLRHPVIGDIHLAESHLVATVKHPIEQIDDKIAFRHCEKALDILEQEPLWLKFRDHPGELSNKRVALIRGPSRTSRSEPLTWRPPRNQKWGHTVRSRQDIGCRQLSNVIGRHPRAIEIVLQSIDSRRPIVICNQGVETGQQQAEHEAPGPGEQVDARQMLWAHR